MKKLLPISFLIISNYCFSQLKSVIIDKETKEKIPYVNIWIENENTGTTSNHNGEFELEINASKVIIFSAIGFETRKIQSDSIDKIIELNRQINELDEVVIKTNKNSQKLIVGKFKKSKINHYFVCGSKPWISARLFQYKDEYKKTPYLNKIRILTKSYLKDSKFKIRLYDTNANGEPGNYIYNQNIFGIAKKGKKITEVDLSKLNIDFPETGFFVAIEWLVIEQNKYEYKYSMKGSEKKLEGITYEPAIGTIPVNTDKNSWIFNQGKWKKFWKIYSDEKKNENEYGLPAIELTLTN